MPDTVTDPTLDLVTTRHNEVVKELRAIDTKATAEGRAQLTEDEETRVSALLDEKNKLEARKARLEDDAQARAAASRSISTGLVGDDGQPHFHVVREQTTYGKGTRNSYFLDLARFQMRHAEMGAAEERLQRHAQEQEKEISKRNKAREERAYRQLEGVDADIRNMDKRGFFERSSARGANEGLEQRVQPSRTDGNGGYFVPPLWMVDEFIPILRNGRPYANLVRQMDLPTGTDSINLPKLTTGTQVGWQGDNGAVPSRDITDTFVNAPVRTAAGQADVPIQLLDQSPVAFDQILFEDLLADYAQTIDLGCLSGTGTSNQIKGLDNVSGTNSVTFTSGSPTVPLMYPALAQALSLVQKNRKRKDGIVFLTQGPRWWWTASALDSQNRPLVPPGPAFNAVSQMSDSDGPDGTFLARPVYVDLNITTTDGGGANQDRIYAVRPQDQYLWEGAMRTRAMQEVLSGALQVRFQIYNYVAFMADRYPSAISIITGTGLTAPSGF